MAIVLISAALVEWLLFEVFLRTKLFTGPEQFAIHHICCIICDLYFALYCPLTWIWMSLQDNWEGWVQQVETRRAKYFRYVRKPDPREELYRKGYLLKKSGHFIYMRKRSDKIENLNRERINFGQSVFAINEPQSGNDLCMSLPFNFGSIYDHC